MKRLVLLVSVAMLTLAMQAQIVSSRSARITSNHVPSFFVDLGIGALTSKNVDTHVGLDVGLRYTKMFTENIGWDAIKVSAQTDARHFSEGLCIQAKTGIRYVSPVITGNNTRFYANLGVGYGHYTDQDSGGLALEGGFGVTLNPNVSLGLVYNHSQYNADEGYYDIWSDREEKVKVGLISLRLSLGL